MAATSRIIVVGGGLRTRFLANDASQPVSLVVIIFNLAIAALLTTHLLSNVYAEHALAQKLGMQNTFLGLMLREWRTLIAPAVFVSVLGLGAVFELKRRSATVLLNPLIAITSVVVLALQLLRSSPPPDAAGEAQTLIVLVGLPMLLIAVLYTALYWSRLRNLLALPASTSNSEA